MKKICAGVQSGFSLVTAIFLLVVLGTLGAMMATFFSTQQQSSALDVMGSRAYQAARAGIEWAAFNVSQQPAGSGCTGISSPLFAAGTLAADLSLFTVTLTCTSTSAVEGGSTVYVYDFLSTASSGGVPGSADYVERSMSVRLSP
jgi:MSHA biogenesis protein MshP